MYLNFSIFTVFLKNRNIISKMKRSKATDYAALTTEVKVAKFSFLNEKSYNKAVINFNFGRHKDLSTLKSDIHLGLAASVNYHFFGWINPYVYLIEVNNCTMLLNI